LAEGWWSPVTDTPDDALIEAVTRRIMEVLGCDASATRDYGTGEWDAHCEACGGSWDDLGCATAVAAARAAYAAMVDHLGLTEETRSQYAVGYFDANGEAVLEHGGTLIRCADVLLKHPNWFRPESRILVRHVTWLQTDPRGEWHNPRCGAEQNTANLPANNPPHVCVDEDPDHWPDTKHHDYSVPPFEWDQPEPRHTLGPP
jgi:hypothetical protein